MGTRYMTVVRKDGTDVICQYGQWDGAPDVVCKPFVEFLFNHGRDLKDMLHRVSLIPLPLVHHEQARHLTRDAGWTVLNHVWHMLSNTDKDVELYDWHGEYWSQAASYLYVADMDAGTLTTYERHNDAHTPRIGEETYFYSSHHWTKVDVTHAF